MVAERREIESHRVEYGDHLSARQFLSIDDVALLRGDGLSASPAENRKRVRVLLDELSTDLSDTAQAAETVWSSGRSIS